ncbi:MAG: EscU/YscU/HrcU family type III secretion system export apparatus switch protein [Desulforegulaceae bacterium]|nr:EscU/YscU/HrcU family type III secretion system export apparatus switch protein [Desulforegulaceae bacterium]
MTKDKKIKKAVALKYDRLNDSAPRVKASGKGKTAEKIIETAKEHNVPVAEDADLAEVLSKLDLEEQIPPDLYKAVAELLAYVYSQNKKT